MYDQTVKIEKKKNWEFSEPTKTVRGGMRIKLGINVSLSLINKSKKRHQRGLQFSLSCFVFKA